MLFHAVITRIENDKLTVVCPKSNDNFNNEARNAGGSFKEGKWHFDLLMQDRIKKTLIEEFGFDGTIKITKVVNLKFTMKKRLEQDKGPVVIGGLVIASAEDRDSGAKWPSNVLFIAGRADSGGSVKNWRTILYENAVFVIKGIQLELAEHFVKCSNEAWEAEIIETYEYAKPNKTESDNPLAKFSTEELEKELVRRKEKTE